LPIVDWDSPERGDIVVFISSEEGKRLVKRVVGIPGDTVAMHNNQLLINGEALRYETLSRESLEKSIPTDDVVLHFYVEDLTGHKHTTMAIDAFICTGDGS
jgi:signal peptidase I